MEQKFNSTLFKMDSKEVILLKKALERQKLARIQAEKILESKSKELYDTARHLKSANSKLEGLLNKEHSSLGDSFMDIVDPYVIMDMDYNVITMNNSAIDFLGYDHRKERLNVGKLVHKDYIPYTLQAFQSLKDVGTLKNYRAKIVVKGNRHKYIQINCSLIYDTEGKPIGSHGIMRDISQETEIKHLLSEQKKQLHVIFDNSPLGIALAVDGKITKANPSFVNLLGYTENELRKFSIEDVSTCYAKEECDELMRQLDQGEDTVSVTKEYIKKNGDTFLAKTNISAVRDENGQIESQVIVIEDITKEKELEHQKEELLSELESSNKNLQEYAHIVSHDLKSPLRSISALASWIIEDYHDKLDEAGQQQLSLMQEKVAAMDKLIQGILEYSTANSSQLKSSEVDLNEIVETIKETIFIPDHVSVKVPEVLPCIQADRTKMQQLFQNIIGNAVAHIEREVGLVEVLFKDKKEHHHFIIKDNGVGIPEEYHKKIFQIFQSIGNKERSTGIGLSIVKKIVDRYEGEVWVESEMGLGTEFHFTLKKSVLTGQAKTQI
ncbi:PAS domain-containing sensor histidine kinase [Pseudozobellia thermophila]|uniref:histidine kinase n=1 Tax=Pseudozobellia thermophila TaxID=192903 RepID=A0A1M6I353_9FLAO|nr:PAS domain-containing sensor histidine kinase [Pseudozobellia thermophila]SHJ28744.1 PAS domain S-box-containing protein [Pseudozobellia thermophila]